MSQLTVRAAARELGIAYSTLKRWIRGGRVRTSRTEGGHHRISDTEVARLQAKPGAGAPRPRAKHSDEALAGLSARNRLSGEVEEIRVDGLLAQVRLRVSGQVLTAVITADAARALKLRRGDTAFAIIKSTEVMVGKPLA